MVGGSRFDVIVDQGRCRRQGQQRLRHVIARIAPNQVNKFFALSLAGLRSDQHAITAGFIGGFDDQLVDVLYHIVTLFLDDATIAIVW